MTDLQQPTLFAPTPETTRCGYCERPLAPVGDGSYECPRCGPILHELGRGLSWDDQLAAFARFQRDAWASRPRR